MKPIIKRGLGSIAMVAALTLPLLTTGCGSSSSSSSTSAVSGTAAVGAALDGATVTATDGSGNTATTTTTASGAFVLPSADLTPPLLIRVVSADNSTTLYTVALTNGVTANITPLTNILFSAIAGVDDPATAFADPSTYISNVNEGRIGNAVDNLSTELAGFLGSSTVTSADFDPIGGVFAADGTGMDLLLETVNPVLDTASGNVTFFSAAGAPLFTINREDIDEANEVSASSYSGSASTIASLISAAQTAVSEASQDAGNGIVGSAN